MSDVRKLTDIRAYMSFVAKVRELNPLVHCITNTVTICDCANILLAAGASPTMAHHALEVAEITAGCKALVCNFGAMDDFDAMLAAAPVAARLAHPIVVDPVGCGGSTFRRARFFELTKKAQITCVRGNASEIRALAKDAATVTGVDGIPETSKEGLDELKCIVKDLAKRLGCIVIASGAVDIVSDGEKLTEVTAGDKFMSRITGCGCMSSVLLGAYLQAGQVMQAEDGKTTAFDAAVAACNIMGYCGEVAALKTREEQKGTMTFHMHLIDEMSMIAYSQQAESML